MTTRQTKRKSAAKTVTTKRIAFTANFRDLFRLTGEGWTPPADVLVRQGTRTVTFVADFLDASQTLFKATVRIDLRTRRVLAEELSVSLKVAK